MLGNNVLTTELGEKSLDARIHMEYRPILTNKIEILLYLSYIDKAKYKAFVLFIEPESIHRSANRNCHVSLLQFFCEDFCWHEKAMNF